MMLIPSLRTEKLLTYLDDYGLANLYQKTGFILTQFSEQPGFSNPFFEYYRSKIPKAKKHLYSKKDALSEHFALHEDWMIFAPDNIKSIISKGVDLSD